MIKKTITIVKLALPAGKATPAPPVGPALGQHGVNIMMFVKEYNAKTEDKKGSIIPAEIQIYEDKSFTFILKTPPASILLKQATGIEKAAKTPGKEQVGSISYEKIQNIAKIKIGELNTKNLSKAIKIIKGTAKNMGIFLNE
nr:ribosomal protein L11 [Cyanidiaceae sp.]